MGEELARVSHDVTFSLGAGGRAYMEEVNCNYYFVKLILQGTGELAWRTTRVMYVRWKQH